MKYGRNEIIETICKKWMALGNTHVNIRQYPRQSVFKLLMIVLNNKDDHKLFIRKNGLQLIQKWIEIFIFTDSLNLNQEELALTICAGLDFFIFHINECCKYYQLLTQDMIAMINIYIQVICQLFQNNNNYLDNQNYEIITNKANKLLQSIINLDFKQFPSSRFIMSRILKRISNDLLPFKQSAMKYNLTENSTLSQIEIIKHLENINKSCNTKEDNNDNHQMREQLNNLSFINKDKDKYCLKISKIFETFLSNYVNTEKFYWNDNKFGGNTKSNLSDIMITCWMLKVIGCNLPDIINKYVYIYLNDICIKGGGLNTTISWIIYCILLTSSSFNNSILTDHKLNMNILLLMTKSVLESVSSEQYIEALILSDIIHRLKKNTFMKYIPLRMEMCLDSMLKTITDNQQELYAFIKFYSHGLCYKDVINCCIDNDNKNRNWWINLSTKVVKVVQRLNDEDEEKEKEEEKMEIIECLNKFSSMIMDTMKYNCNHKMNAIQCIQKCEFL